MLLCSLHCSLLLSMIACTILFRYWMKFIGNPHHFHFPWSLLKLQNLLLIHYHVKATKKLETAQCSADMEKCVSCHVICLISLRRQFYLIFCLYTLSLLQINCPIVSFKTRNKNLYKFCCYASAF
jgi:hypothetical protein